jgi:biopolymer transport protein ExbD
MVDLAFLLVTFFMLTATMRAPEPVIVDTPSSISDLLLPKNTMLLTVDTGGRVFINIEGREVRRKTLEGMLNRMHDRYPDTKFTEEQMQRFGAMQSFGVPFNLLPAYIDAEEAERKKMDDESKGIPMDTTGNGGITNTELYLWINIARAQEYVWRQQQIAEGKTGLEELRFAVKADGDAKYKKIDGLIAIFKKQTPPVMRFNLITDLEADPNDAAPAPAK